MPVLAADADVLLELLPECSEESKSESDSGSVSE